MAYLLNPPSRFNGIQLYNEIRVEATYGRYRQQINCQKLHVAEVAEGFGD